MYSRIGSVAYKADLTNVKALCSHLGNPEQKFRSVHVAGTNGKGSVSHMLASVFQTAGYKTGLYTSPHLYDFRERIRINGQVVSQQFVTSFIDKLQPLIEEIEPSFFEITVAMAFQYFADQKVDIAIIEVGLGGRLDSTNIIHPELSVITNIGFDHTAILGNTLEKIAAEKAGIIKPNVPVVVGETKPETRQVFQRTADEKASSIYWAEEMLQPFETFLRDDTLNVAFRKQGGTIFSVASDLTGLYQVSNLRTALTAIEALQTLGWKLDDESVKTGLQQVKSATGLAGRWEVIQRAPTIVLDVAHNEDGIRRMTEHLATLSFRQLHIVIGMVKDKAVEKILALLPASATYYFTQAAIPRALPAQELQQQALAAGLTGDVFANVNEALAAAKKNAATNDFILVCGSIFLVAEVNGA